MKTSSILAAALFAGAAGTAQAGFLDDIGRVADTVKRGAAMLPGTPAAGNAGPAGSAGAGGMSADRQPSSAAALLPLDLSAYPRSYLQRRVDNPFDRVKIPVSVPVKTPDGFVPPYAVPMEGKVTMLQFTHRSDDSPLLIREHYEAWMAQQGFERLLVCEAPCQRLPGRYEWRPTVDPTQRLDSNYIPEQATYVVGYKQDAMAIVGIGRYIDHYTSLVKVVEGRVLDPQPWKTVTAPKAPPAPVALAKPAPVVPVVGAVPVQPDAAGGEWYGKYGWRWDVIPAGTRVKLVDFAGIPPRLHAEQGNETVKAVLRAGDEAVFTGKEKDGWLHVVAGKAGEGWIDRRAAEPAIADVQGGARAPSTPQTGAKVETISPDQLADRLAQIKGIAVVQFSSLDKGCPFCVQSNPRFETLAQAQAKGADITFLRVMWQPYTQAFDDRLAIQYGLTGLPTFLTFKNGQAVRRVNGNHTAVELHGKLLADLK